MDQPRDGPELGSHAVEQRTELRRVTHIGRGIPDTRSGGGQRGQRRAHLAVGHDPPHLVFQFFRGRLEPSCRGAGEQCPLELGVGRQPVCLGRLIAEFSAPDQQEARCCLLRQSDHRGGGDAAASAGHDDHVAMVDPRRVCGPQFSDGR